MELHKLKEENDEWSKSTGQHRKTMNRQRKMAKSIFQRETSDEQKKLKEKKLKEKNPTAKQKIVNKVCASSETKKKTVDGSKGQKQSEKNPMKLHDAPASGNSSKTTSLPLIGPSSAASRNPQPTSNVGHKSSNGSNIASTPSHLLFQNGLPWTSPTDSNGKIPNSVLSASSVNNNVINLGGSGNVSSAISQNISQPTPVKAKQFQIGPTLEQMQCYFSHMPFINQRNLGMVKLRAFETTNMATGNWPMFAQSGHLYNNQYKYPNNHPNMLSNLLPFGHANQANIGAIHNISPFTQNAACNPSMAASHTPLCW